MGLHNLKQIVRSLVRYKGFTFINLLGLSMGIAATTIILTVSVYENGFDTFHSDSKNVYRIVTRAKQANEDVYNANVPYPTAKFLRNEYPGILATQLHFSRDMNVRIGKEDAFDEKNIVFADSLFFQVLDFSGIKGFRVRGNPVAALSAPNKVILTKSSAKKYFGETNPIGQMIRLNDVADVEVAAIINDIPVTTHFPVSMIVSYSTFNKEFLSGMDPESWSFTSGGYTYVRLDKASQVTPVENAIRSMLLKGPEKEGFQREHWYLQSLKSIHFEPAFELSNPSYTISRKYLQMLLLLAVFILLVACINYINLSTSLAFSKSKEVGIRKTIGASKGQLFFHYMLETVVVTTVAALIGIVIATALLPAVNRILDKSISLQQLFHLRFIVAGIAGIFLISFISGIYPALILSGFNPIAALKNRFILPGKFSALLRKSLVVFQFTTSIALIICTIVIARQMQYMQHKELGFNKESVIEVGLPKPDSVSRESFRTLIQGNPAIENFSFCLGAPISNNGFGTSLEAPELPKDVDYNVQLIPCDKDYLATYEMKLVAGRWFLPGEEKTKGTALVVNESLVRMLGYTDPAMVIGKKIIIGVNHYNPTIIGVTNDFHTTSFHDRIGPVALMPFPYFYYAAAIRLKPGSIKPALADIESAWKKVYPESAYEMTFIDETLAAHYRQEKTSYDLFRAFSVISIFICCIGLWGLIAFVVVRKTKEIGVRKVLGSSVRGIVYLLSKDFLKLVLIALVIASPIAWYLMNKWLQDFAYRIHMSWWIFIAAGLVALLIALVTVSFQAIKAAISNPVKSLRTE
ncbi:MAG TPA: ABC transporter permease [Chitinophagaceae bacterium]|jgi:ABC-type antimicrobial peptide transport system permease subunit|nr:ABC transporter permease [Chitinophagaceae bacterium]